MYEDIQLKVVCADREECKIGFSVVYIGQHWDELNYMCKQQNA